MREPRGEAAEDSGRGGGAEREARETALAGELLGGGDGADCADSARYCSERERAEQGVGGGSAGHQGEEEERERGAEQGERDQDRLAAEAVGGEADERGDGDDHDRGGGREPQRRPLAELAGRGEEDRDIGDADIIGDRPQCADGEPARDPGAVVGEAVAERMRGDGAVGLLADEVGAFVERGAGDEDRGGEGCTEQEGDAPCSGGQGGLAGQGDGCCGEPDREEPADFAGSGGEAGDEAAAVGRGAFDEIGDDPGIFAPDREAHDAAQAKEEDAGERADAGAGGEERGQEHGEAHQRHRAEHHPAAAVAIADMAEQDRPERPREIGDGEPAEGGQEGGLAVAEE